MQELDLAGAEIDQALRKLITHFRLPVSTLLPIASWLLRDVCCKMLCSVQGVSGYSGSVNNRIVTAALFFPEEHKRPSMTHPALSENLRF